MATAIVKYAGKKYGMAQVLKGFSSEDLYYETIVTENRSGKSKTKKVKKRMPPGLTPKEEALLKKAKKRAWSLDMGFNLMGLRLGWSAVVGIVPGIGDVLDLLLAMQVYHLCCEIEPPLPETKKTIMLLNLAIDGLIGLVPFLGDLADGIYKCNTRNVSILENELRKRGEARIKAQQEAADQASRYETQEMRNHGGPPPQYTSNKRPQKPEPAYESPQRGGLRGWFGGRKERDVESGNDIPLPEASNIENSQIRRNQY